MVPKGLRIWFVIHFFADVLFAVPLIVAPERFLGAFGWPVIDPIASRLVGAALLAIGVESLLARNAGTEAYRRMLELKIIWNSAALFAFGVAIASGGVPAAVWLFAAIFAVFWVVWTSYRWRLRAA
jgi:hypothetical protein